MRLGQVEVWVARRAQEPERDSPEKKRLLTAQASLAWVNLQVGWARPSLPVQCATPTSLDLLDYFLLFPGFNSIALSHVSTLSQFCIAVLCGSYIYLAENSWPL